MKAQPNRFKPGKPVMSNPPARYLIDTNIWSALIRRSNPALVERFSSLEFSQVFLSPIVLGELQVGYYKGDQTPKRRLVIEHITANAQLLPLDGGVSVAYGQLRAKLEQAGTPIGPNDTWIAAEALHHKLVLVTDNTREFARVPKLKIENWISHHAD
ncbi:type II toxin-antitoxin system VapC family toxin [Polaromonas hydrogenivorans]|uniref:Ribonuclease VapC n=1 Tax=Polaromonas hydrogenivorans TaxID=335476 RepID=A0AAU7LPD0_9BURK